MEGAEVGRISKHWSGLAREFFTNADHFGISFPMDLDVRMKAVMLGACMLIVIYKLIIKKILRNSLSLNNLINNKKITDFCFHFRIQCSTRPDQVDLTTETAPMRII